jgi:hypothetical protein
MPGEEMGLNVARNHRPTSNLVLAEEGNAWRVEGPQLVPVDLEMIRQKGRRLVQSFRQLTRKTLEGGNCYGDSAHFQSKNYDWNILNLFSLLPSGGQNFTLHVNLVNLFNASELYISVLA